MRYAAFFALILTARAETLHYVINWPSGLNLGEATLSAARSHPEAAKPDAAKPDAAKPDTAKPDAKSGAAKSNAEAPRQSSGLFDPKSADKGGWDLDLDIDASVPGFAVRDHYHSTAGAELCSAVLEKAVRHGSRKNEETVTFHADTNTITRETHGPGGGKSDVSVSACARDALAFLQFARNELAQGRLAPQQSVILGAAYNVRLTLAGTQSVRMGEQTVQADRIQANIKGPASDITVEILFARDTARTPVLARIPLSLGVFTVELTR